MTWFTASVLIAIKPRDYASGSIMVYENMYLIEATTADEGFKKAEILGRRAASIDDQLMIGDRPAKWEFIGIRKLITVSNPEPLNLDQDAPTDGTEVTYALFEVADDQMLAKLAQGEEVDVLYLE